MDSPSSRPNAADVDQPDDVRGVVAEGGDDLAAVGMAGDDRRAGLQAQDVTQTFDVVGDGAQSELRRGDVVAVGLQALDDGAPARAVGPGAVDEDEIGRVGHREVLLRW